MDERLIDWNRVYPPGPHRWTMGLRRGDLGAFLARRDGTDAAITERARWLADDPQTYSALLEAALPALAETVALANSLGAGVSRCESPLEQLLALGRRCEPDLIWMHPTPTGEHQLVGGVVCFPSGWALCDKLGRSMTEIHAPVPELNTVLARPIETWMQRLRPGEAWVRENVGFARDGDLNHHPSRAVRKFEGSIVADEVWLRLEHQLLLKLPVSGSILFGIRVETIRWTRVLSDRQGAGRLAEALATMAESAAAYKGIGTVRHQLVNMCRSADPVAPEIVSRHPSLIQ